MIDNVDHMVLSKAFHRLDGREYINSFARSHDWNIVAGIRVCKTTMGFEYCLSLANMESMVCS